MRIDVSYDHKFLRFSKKETRRAIAGVLRKQGKGLKRVFVVYTNNRHMRVINREHLKHDFVTDVISFEIEPVPEIETEIYVNLDKARVQARLYGESFSNETRRLLIHGLLHVLGFDDKTRTERNRMRREEDAILEILAGEKN